MSLIHLVFHIDGYFPQIRLPSRQHQKNSFEFSSRNVFLSRSIATQLDQNKYNFVLFCWKQSLLSVRSDRNENTVNLRTIRPGRHG